MKIHVEYYAILKEQRGCSQENLDTDAATPRALYASLKGDHAFTLEDSDLKVAVNEDFASWDEALEEGDTVVFIPPVAGG